MSNSKNRKSYKYWPVARTIGCVAAVTGLFAATVTLASGTTTTVPSQSPLAPACTIDRAATLDFGNQRVLAANADQISTIEVTCTNTTPTISVSMPERARARRARRAR